MSREEPDGSPLLARLSERANPVLVKEVRAALRGRAFAAGFLVVLVLAMIVSTFAMIVQTFDPSETPDGRAYLASVSFAFGLGAYGLVPFAAMASMAAEHDDGALELLQMSGISPGRLVLGKLGAASVQAGLIYAAFLPFLAFAFLLKGVDLSWLALNIAASFAGSIAFAALGILFGATLRTRWLRVAGYVVLAVMLLIGIQVAALTMAMGFFGSGSPHAGYALGLTSAAFFAALCCIGATARLQHREENHSTAFRVLGTCALVVVAGIGVAQPDPSATFPWFVAALAVAVPSLVLAVTEQNRLPRAVLSRRLRRGIPLLLAPWLPGGGRGVLLVLVDLALVLAAAVIALVLDKGRSADWIRVIGALALVEAWLCVVLLLPTGIAARWLDRPWMRALARTLVIALPFVMLLFPALMKFLAGAAGDAFRHPGNPAYLAGQMLERGEFPASGSLAFVWGLVALTVALNVPRVVASFGEVRRARVRIAAAGARVQDAAPVA